MNVERIIFIQLHSYPVIAIFCTLYEIPTCLVSSKSDYCEENHLWNIHIYLFVLVTKECFENTGVFLTFFSPLPFFLFGKKKKKVFLIFSILLH